MKKTLSSLIPIRHAGWPKALKPGCLSSSHVLRTLLVFLMTGMTFAYATHFAGGEITYRYISGTTYEVTLKAYRDCSGINYGSSETIRISPTNSGSSFSISRISITDITRTVCQTC